MSPVEERLRATANAVADVITEESAPPLRLAEPRRHPSGARQAWRRRWAGWAAPLAAAAAVIAVAATGLAAARYLPLASQPAAVTAGPAGTPAWYVSLTGYTNAGSTAGAAATTATIRSTSTGRVLASYSPPQPYTSFSVVAAATTGTTFVLGAQRRAGKTLTGAARSSGEGYATVSYLSAVPVTRFYQLVWSGSGGWSSLGVVRAPVETEQVTGAALSPDGSKLAVALTNSATNGAAQLSVQVTTLATGVTRTWSGTGWSTPGDVDPESGPAENTLSWAANDRTLAVDWSGPAGEDQAQHVSGSLSVSLLDTAVPGTDLVADSTAALPAGYGVLYPGDALLTSGGTALTGVLSRSRPGHDTVTSVATWLRGGKAVRQVRGQRAVADYPLRVLWANATGSVLIVAGEATGRASVSTSQVTGSTGSGYATSPPGSAGISGQVTPLLATSTPASVGVLAGGRFIPLAHTGLTLGDLETTGGGIAW